MSDHDKKAMESVLEGMGSAARGARARRYSTRAERLQRPVEVTMGDVTLEPNQPQLSDQDLKDLEDLEIQRTK